MSKISLCLRFATEAEEAAKFYVSLLAESRIDRVQRSPVDTPPGRAAALKNAFAGDGVEAARLSA